MVRLICKHDLLRRALKNCTCTISDSNCIQLVLPLTIEASEISGFVAGDRIGNLCKEISLVLAPLMDNDFGTLACVRDNLHYMIGYSFICRLSYERLNHSRKGYDIEIVVLTSNSKCWVDELYEVLLESADIPVIKRI